MNEKIKELAEQAGYSKEFLAIGLPNNMEKFAELIVKECIQVLDPGGHQLIARFHTRQWLSEHFGVE